MFVDRPFFPALSAGVFSLQATQAISEYVSELEKVNDPRWQAILAAEQKAETAQMQAAKAMAGAISFPHLCCIRLPTWYF